MESKPFVPQGEMLLKSTPDCGSLLYGGHLAEIVLILSHQLHCGLSLISSVQMSCLVFSFSSEEVVQYVATDLVSCGKR